MYLDPKPEGERIVTANHKPAQTSPRGQAKTETETTERGKGKLKQRCQATRPPETTKARHAPKYEGKMAASQAKPEKPFKPRRQMPKPGSKAAAILTLTATTPAAPVEIAESVGCSRGLVSQTLQRYGIKGNRLESYKNHRADVYAGLGMKVLKHLNNEDTLKAASANNLAYTLTQLSTLERTERGQVNMIVGHGIALSPALQESIDKVIDRLSTDVVSCQQVVSAELSTVEDITP